MERFGFELGRPAFVGWMWRKGVCGRGGHSLHRASGDQSFGGGRNAGADLYFAGPAFLDETLSAAEGRACYAGGEQTLEIQWRLYFAADDPEIIGIPEVNWRYTVDLEAGTVTQRERTESEGVPQDSAVPDDLDDGRLVEVARTLAQVIADADAAIGE